MQSNIIKIKQAFLGAILLCCTVYCNKKSEVYLQLECVDSLFTANCDSAAMNLLNSIEQPTDSSEDLAYYQFLYVRGHIRNHQEVSINTIDYPLQFYTAVADTEKMIYIYNYKSRLLLSYTGDKIEAEKCNSIAEDLVENSDNELLKYNVYAHGVSIATYFYDTDKCIAYAKKALDVGEKINDKDRIACPSSFLAICYLEKDSTEIAQNYINKCLTFIDCFDDCGKAQVYNALGEVLERKGDTIMAEHNYLKAIELCNYFQSYSNLTRMYLNRGNITDAEKYFSKAVVPLGYDTNLPIMNIFGKALYDRKDYKRAADVYLNMVAESDSLRKSDVDNMKVSITNLQKHLTKTEKDNISLKKEAQKYKLLSKLLLVGVLLSWIAFIVVLLWCKYKRKKAATQLNEKQMLRGAELLERIIGGENISQWDNEAKQLVTEYYCTTHIDFCNKLTNNYKSIPTTHLIYLILNDIGKIKQEITDIMGISDSAFRSLKSRAEKNKDL